MRLFAYGTLRVPEVLEIVAGRRFGAEPARLEGFRCSALVGVVYPAVLPAPGATTGGVVYAGLDAAAVARIDRFEGDLYERRALSVALASGAHCEALVYVLRPEHFVLATDAGWDLQAFRGRHLRDYLASCRAFVRELT
ncbi:MAG: gamma-glutamylcyclotransferase family protein [Myxococcota bacterium]